MLKNIIEKKFRELLENLFSIFFFIFIILTNNIFADTWQTKFIDENKYITSLSQRSIAIDKITNNPHIAYGGDHLYHAYYNGSIWQYETVDDSNSVGKFASLAIDNNSKVHISYYDVTNGDLKYATNMSGSWQISAIDNIGLGQGTISIAIDKNNKVHISYYDLTNGDLKYATNLSGIWQIFTIDSSGSYGEYTSIAIDSNNKVHISYYEDINSNLKYATNLSGSWQIYIIDSSSTDIGRYSSIAIDGNNKIHISYFDNTNKELKYATNMSGSWQTSTIDNYEYFGEYTSIAIDKNNKIYIIYFKDVNIGLKYATNMSGSWQTSTIDSVGWGGSISIDSNNKVHIGYFDDINNKLKYATNISGHWETSIIDSSVDVGRHTSIAKDGSNKIHISYFDNTNKDLKYATNISGSWQAFTIDNYDYVGEYTSIAIDSSDKVHISYFDASNKDLKYAANVSGSWETFTIDSFEDIGEYTSITIDSNNKIHIGYFDATNGDLKYATNASGSWETFTIDSSGYVGMFTSIAIDKNNKIYICYCDWTNHNLKYATNISGSWETFTIDNSGNVGAFTSIAIDSNNKIHVSYSSSDFKYATNVSGLWEISTIDSIGGCPSILIDNSNKIHISYSDGLNYELKYATNISGSWQTMKVDNIGWDGGYSSIAMDSNNKVYISYYDCLNFDLKYATNSDNQTNNLPIANAGADLNVNTGVQVTLSGTQSSDPDGDSLTYSWTQTNGKTVLLSNPNSVSATFTPDSTGIYEFQLIVNDGTTNSNPDTVVITVNNIPNNPPIANAGFDQTVNAGAEVSLSGASSSDLDGDRITYSWTQTNGKTVILSNPNSVSATFTPDSTGIYEFQLIVNDGKANSNPDTVIITVNNIPNNPPIANAGFDQTVNAGAEVTLNGAESFDGDGDSLIYSWTQTSGKAVLLSNPNLVSSTFTPDSTGTYIFQLIVNDGKANSAPDIVVITVNNIPNNPPIANAGVDQIVFVGMQVTLSGASSYDVDGDILAYSWTQTSGKAGLLLSNLNSVSSIFTPDSAGTYEFQLIVNDGKANSASDTVVITVNNISHNPPIANAGPDYTVNSGEQVTLSGAQSSDADGDILIYSWTQTSGETVLLSNPNSISTTFIPNSEGIYEFQLIVNDGHIDSNPDTVVITVDKSWKKKCFITNIIKNKDAINLINKLKDKYLFQNIFSRKIVGVYYKITTKLQ